MVQYHRQLAELRAKLTAHSGGAAGCAKLTAAAALQRSPRRLPMYVCSDRDAPMFAAPYHNASGKLCQPWIGRGEWGV